MTLGFSTSSPIASVAAFDLSGELTWSGQKFAPRAAGNACLGLLEQLLTECDLEMASFERFVADVGPGSFTGVRVGVTLAKTFAYLFDREVGGASAFDLISPTETVAIPSRKGEFFVRDRGGAIELVTGEPTEGIGYGMTVEQFPLASGFAQLLPGIRFQSAAAFVPDYKIEPSISLPKRPYDVA